MRKGNSAKRAKERALLFVGTLRTHPLDYLKRTRRVIASIVAWLIGFLLLGVGFWILMLRFEGLVDLVRPRNMSIGQITVDGTDSKGYAELLRARFDYHFRRPVAMPKDTGFVEVAALGSPDLFQEKGLAASLEKMTVEVSGVDVAKIVQLVNSLAKPDQWVVEGDFQTRPDRAMLALRLSRGDRLIRTWYLERLGNTESDKPLLLEQLLDDAIFQLVYDFSNEAEKNSDLRKWRNVVSAPTSFPTFAAAAAYYKGRGALGRYYATGDWKDLNMAVEQLRLLRGQMPEYDDGLELLGLALTEQSNETEAIHVYDQLRLLLQPPDGQWNALTSQQKRRLLSIELMQATATTKLYTWQSTHEAIAQLLKIVKSVETERAAEANARDKAAINELMGQTAAQLSYAYALYLSHLENHTVAEVFGNPESPQEFHIANPEEINILRDGPPADAKKIVLRVAREVVNQHQSWIKVAGTESTNLESKWHELTDGNRRRADLTTRQRLASGYAHYKMSEWENPDADAAGSIFGKPLAERLDEASKELGRADAAHPNHYLVLQLLGLVHGERRRPIRSFNIAEQYFERAIRANPSDYYGHLLLGGILHQRTVNRGIGLSSRPALEKGLSVAQEAINRHEISGAAHLLRAQFEFLLLEIEVDPVKRRELRSGLEQHLDQAARFLPTAFGQPDPELTWLRIVSATRRLGEQAAGENVTQNGSNDTATKQAQKFKQARDELLRQVSKLIADCERIETRWVAQHRVFEVTALKRRAQRLNEEILRANQEDWSKLHIPLQ